MANEEFDIDIDTITIDIGEDTIDPNICIDTSSIVSTSYNFNLPSYSIGAIGSAGSFLTSSGSNGTNWTNIGTSSGHTTLKVTGAAEFEGNVTIKGVSLAKTLEGIQSRLSILVPDPAKLEHFAALKKAYEHYKTLEALCEIPKQEDKE